MTMFKKWLTFLFIATCSTVIFAQEDYAAGWKAAQDLYRAGKYAEAQAAFTKLAETAPSFQSQCDCYRLAGYSARNLKKYDEAIALADKIAEIPSPYPYYSKVRRMEFMLNAGKYKEITEMFKSDDILKWPPADRPEAFHFLGLAYYYLKQGKEAEAVFKLGKENASFSGYWSGVHSLRSGHNYRYLMNDNDKAVAAFKEVVAGSSGIWEKCDACHGIAELLVAQKKYDEALAEYDKLIALKGVPGYWVARALLCKGNILKTMEKKDEAVKCYEQSIATKGCPDWIKNGCQSQLKTLQPKTE